MRYLFLLLFFSCSALANIANSSAAAKINTQLGFSYLSNGLYSLAKERFLTAIQEDSTSATSWYGMAYFFEKTGNLLSAKKCYEKALKVEPHSGAAKNNYGVFLCREKHYKEAIRFFIAAANESTYLHAASAYNNAGLCAIKMQDNKTAKQYFQSSLRQNPQNNVARVELKSLA